MPPSLYPCTKNANFSCNEEGANALKHRPRLALMVLREYGYFGGSLDYNLLLCAMKAAPKCMIDTMGKIHLTGISIFILSSLLCL